MKGLILDSSHINMQVFFVSVLCVFADCKSILRCEPIYNANAQKGKSKLIWSDRFRPSVCQYNAADQSTSSMAWSVVDVDFVARGMVD